MNFVYPSFLWGLLALAIPIIIHLFYFRRFKKVYFTNVKFLKEIKEETSSKSKLKHLMVLLSRLAAVAALVLAFAQPFIPLEESAIKQGKKAVSLFIDNSWSMSSMSQDVPLLQKAKQRATEIVKAYSVEDRFQILTNDFEGRHQRMVSKEDALSLIEEVKITPSVKEMSKTLLRQKQALNSSDAEHNYSYLISDFQKNVTDISEKELLDTMVEVTLVPLQSVQKRNISVDSCWFEAPVRMLNQTNPLIIKVSNRSDDDAEDVRINLTLDNQVKPLGNLSVKANSFAYDTVNVTILKTGWHEAKITITDFPVQFDDSYYFTFEVLSKINILTVNGAYSNKYLDAVFKSNPYFQVTNQNSGKLDYSKFTDYQLIILNELKNISSGLGDELLQFANNGGNVLVFPSKNSSIPSYTSFLSSFKANEFERYETKDRSVSYMNTDEFIFNDVFERITENIKLPETKGNFKMTQYGSRGEEVIFRYRDGSSYMGKYKAGQGSLYVCSAPLDVNVNNLAKSGEIFVPLLYKMSISTGKDVRIAYVIGKDNLLETANKSTDAEMVYKLKGEEEFIPEQKSVGPKTILSINNQIKQAGYYNLYLEQGTTLNKYAFNYDRKESKLDYFSEKELEEKTGENAVVIKSNEETNFTELIGERSMGKIYWKWCLIAALIFLLIEILLIKFWRT